MDTTDLRKADPRRPNRSQRGASPIRLLLVLGLLLSCRALGQTFQNLDFEAAVLVPVPGGPSGLVEFGPALPAWTGYCGTKVQAYALYNNQPLDSAGICIFGTNYSYGNLKGIIHGKYCVMVKSGSYPVPPGELPVVNAAIAQTGTVPTDAKSIVFNTSLIESATNVVLTFNGTALPVAALTSQSNSMVLGADVNGLGGQTGEVRFTVPILWSGYPPWPRGTSIVLDYIRYSTAPLAAAPVIISPPKSQWANMGSNVELRVSATGYPTPDYQWFYNSSTAIPGAKSSILQLTNVQVNQSGAYSVIISNVYGTRSSAPAILEVRDPFITDSPGSRTVDAGQMTYFQVGVGGTQPFTFQWLKNMAPLSDDGRISGSRTPVLTLSNLSGADAGSYSVSVGNVYSNVVSIAATLTVRDPVIVTQPVSQSVEPGGTASFRVVAAGAAPFGYQWFGGGVPLNDGENVAGARTSTVTLSNVFSGEADVYSVVVDNGYGSVTSVVAFLNINPPNYSVLRSFSKGRTRNADLVLSGTTLYGTAEASVFKVHTDGTGYEKITDLIEGANGGLILSDGAVYGTTYSGENAPSPDFGKVFKVNTDGSGFAVLKSFSGGADGGLVWSAPVLSGATLYGTTYTDGSSGEGTLFKVNTDGSGFGVLLGFGSTAGGPQGGLAILGDTLYGTLTYDAVNGIAGKVFKVKSDGSNFEILKAFAGNDGRYPLSGLALSGTTLYGTTYYGGGSTGAIGSGTVFKLNTDGSGFAMLKSFGGGIDGANPRGDLVLCGSKLYGTTSGGGISNYGTVFMIDTESKNYTVLKRFRGGDGAEPGGGLVMSDGVLYGTTERGGDSDSGVIFALLAPNPNVVSGPMSQTAERGSTASFRVRATGGSKMTYQWFLNETNPVTGVTTNTGLQLMNVQPWQAGAYTVVVTNIFSAVTSAPAMLGVIPGVERRMVPAVSLAGQPGTVLSLEDVGYFGPSPNWAIFDSVTLTNTSQWYFDLSAPAPQRFYRARQVSGSQVVARMELYMVPAITLTGGIGSTVRIDCISRFGPVDAWVTLDTVRLSNASGVYFDTSSIGQPARLWRVVPVP